MSSSTTTSTKKTVSFRDTVRMKKSLHINDFSEQEVSDSWYSAAELKQTRLDIKAEVRQYAKQGGASPCPRGLEKYTTQGSNQRRLARLQMWNTVLDEQDHESPAETIAALIHDIASASAYQAMVMGHLDYQAAAAHGNASTKPLDVPPTPVTRKLSAGQQSLVVSRAA